MGSEMCIRDRDRVGPQAQFAYAVATDGSVRVAEVLNVLKECDTQVDPRTLVAETSVARLGCLPVGDPLTPARRPGATGPGIVLPGDGIPSAVNIVRIDALPQEMRTASPTKLIGVFGVVTSTNGGTFVVDIDDDDKADVEDAAAPLSIDLATTLPHQLRDQVSDRGAEPKVTTDTGTVNFLCNSTGPGIDAGGGLSGGARLAGAVNLLTLPEVIADVKRAIMPTMQHLLCTGSDATVPVPELSFAAPPDIRESRFPDTQRLKSVEDWRLVWEGSLSGDNLLSDINGPTIRSGTLSVAGGALKMIDRSRPFCAAGVESYDLVQLRGCDPQAPTAQCPLGTKCYVHPDTTTGAGSCLPEKTADQLAETCRDFLVSLRRYTVSEAKTGELTLLPRQRVLRSTPLGGCRTVDDCNTLARDEAKLIDEAHPSQSTATARYAYACEADPSRKDSATIKRCVMTCTRDADCESGSVCGDTNRCMEGVTPPAACVQSVQRYELRAGEAFTVLGTQSGYIHPVIKDPGSERCIVPDAANRNPLQIGRIPLTAPACGSAGDPNPCLTEVGHVEDAPLYQPGTCDVATPANALRHRDGVTGGPHGVLAKTPAIRFRGPGMTFHLVDPYYPGDVCRGDRKGPWRSDNSQTDRPAIPTAFTGFALTFRQGGGYAPLGLRTSSTVPVKVVRGPQQSIWIVDEGDYLSESSSLPSTRGKVFRIEGASINTVNVMQ